MKKTSNNVYEHKGYTIVRDNKGRTWIVGYGYIFQTYYDAKWYIDKKLDGCANGVPRVVGEWREENYKEIQKNLLTNK